MISKKYKAIFIHIEKTAGTRIEQKLGHFEELKRGVQDHNKIAYYKHMATLANNIKSVRYCLYCLKLKKYKKMMEYFKNFITPKLTYREYQSYFKFTVVRNSWSRIFSYYNAIMRDDFLRSRYGISIDCNMGDFIKNHVNPKEFSQLSYICDDNGKINLDFIIRFENLEKDFEIVANKLGVKNPLLPRLLLSNSQKNYRDGYDAESRYLVSKLFKDEIEYFGFSF